MNTEITNVNPFDEAKNNIANGAREIHEELDTNRKTFLRCRATLPVIREPFLAFTNTYLAALKDEKLAAAWHPYLKELVKSGGTLVRMARAAAAIEGEHSDPSLEAATAVFKLLQNIDDVKRRGTDIVLLIQAEFEALYERTQNEEPPA